MATTISDNGSNQSFDYNSLTGNNQDTSTDATNATTTVNFLFLDNDSLSNSVTFATIQSFNGVDYEGDPSTPNLDPPATGEVPPKPYGTTEQGMIKQFFSDEVISALKEEGLTPEEAQTVYNAIMTGTVPTNPKLATLANKISLTVTQKTIQEGNLPSTWSITSTSAKDWTPLPIEPYSSEKQTEINEYYDQELLDRANTYLSEHALELDPDAAINLIKAIQTGEVSSDIADIYIQLTAEARVATQEAFGLPASWFKGTTSVDDWKPVNIGIITPAKVANARLTGLLNNAEQILEDINNAAQALLAGPPPIPADDPRRVALTEFLKIIGDAIRELKAILREIQIRDAEKTKENTKAKFSMLADRRLRADEQTKKMEEMMKKQKEMKSMGLAMKIIGPIIAALATILGVLISIASLGTATAAGVALIAAGVTVGVAMTAYAIADSVTNVTQKIVTAFKDMLERLMPDSPEWAKALVKAIIVAVVVAILAVIIAVALASGGGAGAATNLASQAVQQTVRMAIMEAVKQIALQAMIMTIMSSNVLPELVGGILKASGVDKKTQQIVEMIVMAITLVACLIVMVKVGNMKVPGMEAGEAAEESAKTATEQAKNAVKEFSSNLEKMKEALKKLPAEAMDEWTSIIDGFKKLDKWDILSALCSSAPSAVQLVGGSITGSMQLKVSRLLKDIGEVKSAEEELEALIQALETLLRNIQQGMMNRDDFIAQLQQMYNNIYDAASKSQSLLFNALQG